MCCGTYSQHPTQQPFMSHDDVLVEMVSAIFHWGCS